MTENAPALWLWMDVESTGLLDSRPVVLEAAWMVTDDQIHQLTPLRQRLTALACMPTWPQRIAAWARFHVATPRMDSWPHLPMHPRVEDMHVESGLSRDWRSGEKISDVRVLDELIVADLADGTIALDSDARMEIHLAGAGVAQFEARLLPAIGSTVLEMCHYRCADSSVAGMTLGLPKVTSAPPGDYLSVDIQSEDAERAITDPHRAAADVRAAWHQVRTMRTRMGTLEGSTA